MVDADRVPAAVLEDDARAVGQPRAVRRSAWILGMVALAFYVAFIWMSVARS